MTHRTRSLGLAALLALLAVPALAQSDNQIEKGRRLTLLSDCAACHTAGQGAFAGGVPLETPFGLLVGSNITPDPETGIGRWSRAQFRRAVKEGVSANGHQLYPAMPYTDYVNMPDEDVDAIYDYLQTVQPVHNPVVSNQLPFPLNQRIALLGWKMVNETDPTWALVPGKSDDWNRGRYIVMGPAHCGACHTPRNLSGGSKTGDAFLTGATIEGWHAPDITPAARTGIGNWSEEEIAAYLATGKNRFDIASGPMAEEVELSSSKWNAADLKAVAVYLKEGEEGRRAEASAPAPLAADSASMKAGAAIYGDRCTACHGPAGEGIEGIYPRLAGAPLVVAEDPTSLARVMLVGSQAGGTHAAPTAPVMPSFGTVLDDAQVAAVADYIRNSWGNAAAKVDAADVRKLREEIGQ